MQTSVRIVGIQSKMKEQHFPNTSYKLSGYLLCNVADHVTILLRFSQPAKHASMWFMHNGAQLTAGMWFMHNGAQLTAGMWFMHNGAQLTAGMWFMHSGAQLTTGMWFMHNGAQYTAGMWFMHNGAEQTPVLSTRQLQTALLAWPQRSVDLNAVDIQIVGTGRSVCVCVTVVHIREVCNSRTSDERRTIENLLLRQEMREGREKPPVPHRRISPNLTPYIGVYIKYIKFRAQWTSVPIRPSVRIFVSTIA